MPYTVVVPDGQGDFREEEVPGAVGGAKQQKSKAEALTRAAGPFYGNKEDAFDASKPSGLRKAADFDKLRNTNLHSGNFGCNREHRAALEKCACGCGRVLWQPQAKGSRGVPGDVLKKDRAAYESIYGDTGEGPHRLMRPECATRLQREYPDGDYPAPPALPPAGIAPPTQLLLTDGAADGQTALHPQEQQLLLTNGPTAPAFNPDDFLNIPAAEATPTDSSEQLREEGRAEMRARMQEVQQRAAAEQQRADNAEQRAAAEKQRADSATQRANEAGRHARELEEKLRGLEGSSDWQAQRRTLQQQVSTLEGETEEQKKQLQTQQVQLNANETSSVQNFCLIRTLQDDKDSLLKEVSAVRAERDEAIAEQKRLTEELDRERRANATSSSDDDDGEYAKDVQLKNNQLAGANKSLQQDNGRLQEKVEKLEGEVVLLKKCREAFPSTSPPVSPPEPGEQEHTVSPGSRAVAAAEAIEEAAPPLFDGIDLSPETTTIVTLRYKNQNDLTDGNPLDEQQFQLLKGALEKAGYKVRDFRRDKPGVVKDLEAITGNVFLVVGWHGLRGGLGTYRLRVGQTVHPSHMGNRVLLDEYIVPRLTEANVVGVYFDACWAGDCKDLPRRRVVTVNSDEIAQWEWDGRPIAGPVADPLTTESWKVITQVLSAPVHEPDQRPLNSVPAQRTDPDVLLGKRTAYGRPDDTASEVSSATTSSKASGNSAPPQPETQRSVDAMSENLSSMSLNENREPVQSHDLVNFPANSAPQSVSSAHELSFKLKIQEWKDSVDSDPQRPWALHALELRDILVNHDRLSYMDDYMESDAELQRLNRVLIRRRFEQPRDPNDKMIHSPKGMDFLLALAEGGLNFSILDVVDTMEEAVRLDRTMFSPYRLAKPPDRTSESTISHTSLSQRTFTGDTAKANNEVYTAIVGDDREVEDRGHKRSGNDAPTMASGSSGGTQGRRAGKTKKGRKRHGSGRRG
jgi:hypothetical protein